MALAGPVQPFRPAAGLHGSPVRPSISLLLRTSSSRTGLSRCRPVPVSLRRDAFRKYARPASMRSGGILFRGGVMFESSSAVSSGWLPSTVGFCSRKVAGLAISRRNVGPSCRKGFRSFTVKAQAADVKEVVTAVHFEEASATKTRPSPDLRDSSREESTMRGIVDVIGKARTLDYVKESFGEEGQRARSGESSLDWKTDERLRRSCEAGSTLRVAVLLSGGVDSSVALQLLCNAGHSCTAFYLKIWFQEDFENFWSSCPWEEDLSYAQDICDEAGVELKVVHLTDAYWGKVVSESILDIQAGRTPNPDMLCNSRIKFGEFLEHIKDEQFDRVASGHYARVERVANNNEDQVTQLHLSADEAKDQTYFLSQLSQSQLSRLMFPLGELSKVEVREVAMVMGLSNKKRKDSQGICFLGKVKFREFIARHLGEREGCLVEAETGELLGIHKGFWFYTIGQRQGIGLSHGPWFVVAKDVNHNVVFISRNYFNEKNRTSFRVGSFNWASGSPPLSLANMRCKIGKAHSAIDAVGGEMGLIVMSTRTVRHGPKFYKCTMNFDAPDLKETNGIVVKDAVDENCFTALVNLEEDDQGLAPGQYAAFYQGGVCLGSGIILEAFGDDNAMNVSVQALEIAKVCSNPKFLKDQRGQKWTNGMNRGGRAAKPGDAVLGSGQEETFSRLTKVGPEDDTESLGRESTGSSRKEKIPERTDSGIWHLSLQSLERFFSWLQI